MRVIIQRNQIRYFEAHQTESGVKDILQLGVGFVDYAHLPTYGISVDVTGITSQAALRAALVVELQALQARVQAQIQNDEWARTHFDDWGWADTEFEIDSL